MLTMALLDFGYTPVLAQVSQVSLPGGRLLEALGILALVNLLWKSFRFVKWGFKLFRLGINAFRWDANLRRILRIHRRRQRHIIRITVAFCKRQSKMLRFTTFFIFSNQGRCRLTRLQYHVREQANSLQKRHQYLICLDRWGLEQESPQQQEEYQRVVQRLDDLDMQVTVLGNIKQISDSVAQAQSHFRWSASFVRDKARLIRRLNPAS